LRLCDFAGDGVTRKDAKEDRRRYYIRMNFDLNEASEILERTPAALGSLLGGLSTSWTDSRGNRDEWQPYDVLGHLIHGEKTDWIPRARIILAQEGNVTFEPFDRLAQFEDSKGKSLAELLEEFAALRADGLKILRSWQLTPAQLDMQGIHPELGKVTLRQLLATWVVHDLNHIRQIATAMAGRYREDVGVWQKYLSILN
jgi:hypothetical protein